MENVNLLYKKRLLQELRKREELQRQIQEIVLSNYVRNKQAVKRGKVQALVAEKLNRVVNAKFRRTVTKALLAIGIRAVCTHKTYLYRGIGENL